MFSKSLKSALFTVSSQIAPDCDPETQRSKVLMAEMTLYALELHDPEAYEELREKLEQFGYQQVLKAASLEVATD